jgi:hypothetical protein
VKVIGGSMVMALGALVIALSSVKPGEHERWKARAAREAERYGVDSEFTRARVEGLTTGGAAPKRSWVDWAIVSAATMTLAGFALWHAPPRSPSAGNQAPCSSACCSSPSSAAAWPFGA